MKTFLVTGGCGFIGSNFVRLLLKRYKNIKVVNLDKLTYAGNPDNLKEMERDKRYTFIKGDIADYGLVKKILKNKKVNYVINFAAETHVDRSILGSADFIMTNALGVYTLLEACRNNIKVEKFIQIGTDEVYGSVKRGYSRETDKLYPSNPYSAAKAAGDEIALSFYRTYKMPVIITRSANNYGPYQYPEKLIPLFITNAMEEKPLPLYGDGKNVRDWLYVEDNCRAVLMLLKKGKPGEIYNISGWNHKTNIQITNEILKSLNKPKTLIKKVKDRPGHDRRYAINAEKSKKLGWQPKVSFEKGMKLTVDWYLNNEEWWRKLKDKDFKKYYKKQYGRR